MFDEITFLVPVIRKCVLSLVCEKKVSFRKVPICPLQVYVR